MISSADISHRELSVMDWKIHCAVAGKGPPVVLFHGLGASWHWWLPTIQGLRSDFTFYAVDLPGSGESTPLTFQPKGEDFAQFTSETLEALQVFSAPIVGHSLGGYVALQSAIHRVASVQGLALIAPGGVTNVHLKMYHLLALPLIGDVLQTWYSRFGLRVALRSLVHDPMAITDEQLDWSASSLSRRENRRQFLYQLRLASKIQLIDKALGVHGPIKKSLPVEIFWGRHDPLFPISASFELQGLLGCGPPDIFEDSGHIPQVEHPEKFNASLREFLLSLSVL